MGLRTLVDIDGGRAVIYDSVTDVPLPQLGLFPSEPAACHFLLWAEREHREPFNHDKHYNLAELLASQHEWYRLHIDGGSGELTDEAYREWEESL